MKASVAAPSEGVVIRPSPVGYAVLCPGPSLFATWKGDRERVITFAVNRAIMLVPSCDWFVARDRDAAIAFLGKAKSPPRIGLAGSPQLSGMAITAGLRCDDCMRIERSWPHGTPMSWSVTTAMALAVLLSHERQAPIPVDVYGCDMAGATYADGSTVEQGATSVPVRWSEERPEVEAVADVARRWGVPFTLHSPGV